MKENFISYKKGMTLIELIVTTGIVVFLVVVVSTLLVRSISAYRISNKSISLQEDAAKVMREFEYSARAATEVITSTENEFSYYRYFDLDSTSPSRVRFFAENGEFKMGRTEPQGTEPDIREPEGLLRHTRGQRARRMRRTARELAGSGRDPLASGQAEQTGRTTWGSARAVMHR